MLKKSMVYFLPIWFLLTMLQAQDMLKIRELSEQELIDMMVGSSIQATRGNNSERMIERILSAREAGKKFTIISVDEIPDDWMAVVTCGVGGGLPWEYVEERIKSQNINRIGSPQLEAVKALSRYLDKDFKALIRSEPAGATLTAMLTAAELGIPIVDACLSGRARPEVQQQIPFVVGIPATPAAMVTLWGDTLILECSIDDYRLEDLARGVAVASGGAVWLAMNAMSGRDIKNGVIPGNLTQAMLFGRTVREAREKRTDPVEALVEVSNGYKLFHGVVVESEYRSDRGFHWADVKLKGIREYQGHVYKIFIKNENIISWLDDEPDVMSPDLICNLNPQTGDAVNTWGSKGYPIGQEVVMVGIPANPLWRKHRGIEVLGPRHFGFDFDYVPIEVLQRRKAVTFQKNKK